MEKITALYAIRHSCEHVLAQAILKFFPGIKMAMGPATNEGFYFDFDPGETKISETDFPKIEAEMAKIIKEDTPIEKEELPLKEARKLFKNNEYKQEWLDEIEHRKEKAVVYWTGRDFVDLCAGPHVESTGKIGPFKLLSLAGAYWRGDEKNKMLIRIYGTCFLTKEELDRYLWQLEEAKKRDHRKIGETLELFTINEKVGPGLILWLPKGNIIKEELEKWAKETEKEWGYERITTPNITRAGLYYTSGHLPYYQKDMYPPMRLDGGEEYFLKPMNCPHHHMIFSYRPRSYKELPLRLAEYGDCYRYEASGELFGLMRVRGMTQNDAHIYCTLEQAVDEFLKVMELHEYYYKTLNINDYHLELALRDPKNKEKYHGDEKMWQLAEELTRKAIARTKIKMVEQIGNAAFYGPKIDFIVHSSIGREFAVSTNQIDLFMGERFGLKYIDKNGRQKTPVIIHRAPLGSHERFIGFLIEHFAGAFPTWLSPVQVVIIPISEKHLNYGKGIYEVLREHNIRVEIDRANKTMQEKIRSATLQKVPYMIIIGNREMKSADQLISLRKRDGTDLGQMPTVLFKEKLKEEIRSRVTV